MVGPGWGRAECVLVMSCGQTGVSGEVRQGWWVGSGTWQGEGCTAGSWVACKDRSDVPGGQSPPTAERGGSSREAESRT